MWNRHLLSDRECRENKPNACRCPIRRFLDSSKRCPLQMDCGRLMTDPKKDIDRLQREMDQARTDAANAGLLVGYAVGRRRNG